jgi:hypothetical protein
MSALKRCTRLASLNGCNQYQEIMRGGLVELDLYGYEIGLAVGPFLPLSASTLTSLDLR